MSQQPSVQETINYRFDQLFLGLDNVQEKLGVSLAGKVNFEQTEQANARRELLRVEKLAIRDKELNAKSEQSYIDSMRDMVHVALREELDDVLKDTDFLFRKVLGLDNELAPLLDLLTVKAATIPRIESAAVAIPWLFDDLTKFVNSPKYRRLDAKGNVVTVDTLRTALSFVGIDNLKIVVPSLSFRRTIPQITDPYPQLKTRIWEFALGTALSCQAIAPLCKVDPSHAYTLGLFHDLGRNIVTKLYFRLFDKTQRAALVEAQRDKKHDEHDALTKIAPSGDYLLELINELGASLSAKMVSMMDLKRVFISTAMQEYAQNVPVTEMTPLSRVLLQGVNYTKYRMLKAYRLINVEEAKAFLVPLRMPNGALSTLKTVDLRHMHLDMDDSQ
ncbi:HDOD domain-containing protein [Aestuariibacter salexigens]|uniref:HDOD domain-containing protein n=1 Tax=Aestuariibacter salexigens TaxID=226010 RepID=UPI0003FC6812|nr:HDOD domain-containing protein [Aestuariibacter salexigens]